MKSKPSRRIVSILALSSVLIAGVAVAAISENTGVPYGGTVSLTGPDGVCKKVTNTSPTGLQLYVPGNTTAEWQSFIANKPSGVTFASCHTDYLGWQTDTSAEDWLVTSYYTLNPAGWVNMGSLLPVAGGYAQLVVIDPYVYLIGGTSGTVNNGVYRALTSNPTSWSYVGAIPTGRSYYSQAAVIGGYVYLFGGASSASATNQILRASTSDLASWSVVGTLPTGLTWSQVAIIGNYIYLFGGWSGGANTNIIYRASVSDPLTWTNTGRTLPTSLEKSQLAIIGDYIYLFGGDNPYSSSRENSVNVIYRAPVSDPLTWTNTGRTLPGVLSQSQVAVIGDYVYLFGGNAPGFTNVIYRAPVTDPLTWSNTGSVLPAALYGSQVAIIGSNVYLFGGVNGTPYTKVIFRAPLTPIP